MNNTYYNEIKRLKTFDNEKIKEIYARVENGEPKAINEIITGNLKFVVLIAKKYYHTINNKSIIELDDLISEGNFGLIKACSLFKLEHGVRFSTYAVYWIRKYIQDSINQNEAAIRLPQKILLANRRIKKIINQLYQTNQYEPTRIELENLEMFTKQEIETYFLQKKITNIDDQYHIEDELENADDKDYQTELKRKIVFALRYLTPKERLVIRMKFGIDQQPAQPQQIWDTLKVTRQRTNQITQSALAKLKDILGTDVI